MPRSFSGRTKVFEAFYVGSIPALGAKLLLAWCTVHRRTYKPLRSRLEHGLGSTPSASTMRSKLMRMSSRFLLRRRTTATSVLCAGSAGSWFDSNRTHQFLELWPNGEALDF
jgi:hypothetical protein